MANLEELKLDLDEFKRLSDLTTREKVRTILSMEIRKLQTSISNLEAKESAKDEPQVISPSGESSQSKVPKTYTVKIENYAWDQSDKFMKIYAPAKDVKKIPEQNVKCTFTKNSFNLMVQELNGKNYQLQVGNLMQDIIPEESKIKIKTDDVLVMLKKAEEKKTWAYVTKREADSKADKDKPPKMDENADPQAGLMDMMKKMYDDGDDDMKRTIAKAWTESRDKGGMGGAGGADSMAGGMGGMMGGMAGMMGGMGM